MIDWVRDDAKHWGWQMRITHCGKDGWPPRTTLDKMIKEGVLGASVGRFAQHLPECLDEAALEFNNLLKTLPEEHRVRFFIHDCILGKAKFKAWRLGETKTMYYDRLDEAHKAYSEAFAKRAKDHKNTKYEPNRQISKRPVATVNGMVCANVA